MTNVPIFKFMFRSEWKALTDAIQLSPVYDTREFNSASELTTFLGENPAAMIVASLRDKDDFIQLATLMKLIKRMADKPSFVKVIVVNFSGNKQYEKAVAKLNLDLLEEKIQTKALRFKIDFMLKSINAQMKKNANLISNSVKSLENNKAQDKKIIGNTAISNPPIECEDDFWILRNESDCKTVLNRWLVKLLGPSPYVASWVDSGNPGMWKFEFKSQNELLVSGNGSWFYKGDQKPDFIWSENVWSFTGNAFDLFYKDGNDVFSRLKLKEKQLTIAKNSEYARTKEKTIIDTFDKDLVFKKELQANSEKESFDAEQEKLKNLEGKGKTEAITQGPLSGKGKTEALTQGPLSGKGSTSHINTDPLSMDLKPDDTSSSTDPLSQKTTTSKGSSYWKGKNEYEQEGFGEFEAPTDQAINSGEQLSLENKKHTHETYYKNHNEAEKFAGKDPAHSLKKDGISDNLKGKIDPSKSSSATGGADLNGKNSTDHLDGHLSSPNAAKEKAAAEKTERELSGKSSTDKISGHLSSENAKKNRPEHSEKERTEKAEKEISAKAEKEKQGGSLTSLESERLEKAAKIEKAIEAKIAEEKLAGQQSSPNARQDKTGSEKAENDLSGKSSTDKIQGHLTSENAKKDKVEKENNEKEFAERPTAEKMASQLAALREKKDRIEKEKEEKAASDSVEAEQKHPGRVSQGGTDKITNIYSSRTKTQEPTETKGAKDSEKAGKVLPFVEKETSLESTELEDAVQTASVTSYLTQDSLKILCHLDDYFDQTLIFTTKENGITQTKNVILNLNFNYMNKDTNLRLNGEVKQVEGDNEGFNYITVDISKDNASAFKAFMKVYETRQENINVFLKAVKGY